MVRIEILLFDGFDEIDALGPFEVLSGAFDVELVTLDRPRTVAGRRTTDEVVAAHADWYCGNLRVDAGRVVVCFDWDLVADTVAVVVGLTAGFFANGSEPGPPQVSPEQTVAFLSDVESALGMTFSTREQEVAAAAVVWSQAYTARCGVSMLDGPPDYDSVLDNLHRNRSAYLALRG